MGTAFTEEQIATLWKLSPEPVVCFDSDRAGQAAANRSIDRILPLLTVGRTFRYVFMREEKDPDDLIREKGVEAFNEVLSGSLPIWDVLWERETAEVDVRTPDKQAALEQKLYGLVRAIKDPTVHKAYFRTCRMQLANLFWQAGRSKSPKQATSSSKLVRDRTSISHDGPRHGLQRLLLGMLVHYPDFLEEKQDKVLSLQFAPELQGFWDALYQLLVIEEQLTVQLIYNKLKPDFYEILESIHGDESNGRPKGYRLFLRFPILKSDPPRDFISRCMDHFMDLIHLHQIGDDIARVQFEAGQADGEGAMEQLMSLVKAKQETEAAVQAVGLVLAEEANQLKRVWVPNSAGLQVSP